MPQTTGYSIASYGEMIADKIRMDAYAEALRRAVTPGCVVVDIGAGTGIASLLACHYGARHVYAIEPDDAIDVARESARRNGLEDRITFLQANSMDVVLPELADVMVSDLRGVLPLLQHHIPSIRDGRRRLLKPSGVQIPCLDRLFAAPVENARAYQRCVTPWERNDYGIDLSAGRRSIVNGWWRAPMDAGHLLAPPQQWASIDYMRVEDTTVAGRMRWRSERGGTVHGWLLWFETELLPGIGYSNSPQAPELIYGQGFFPLEAPVELRPGDTLDLDVSATLVGAEYVWRWNSAITPAAGHGAPRRYSQSTFYGMSFASRRLAVREGSHVPALGLQARLDQAALELLDGRTSLDVASEAIQKRFPGHFPDRGVALTFLADLCERYPNGGKVG